MINSKIEAVLSRIVKLLYFLSQKCRLRAVSHETKLRDEQTLQFILPCKQGNVMRKFKWKLEPKLMVTKVMWANRLCNEQNK